MVRWMAMLAVLFLWGCGPVGSGGTPAPLRAVLEDARVQRTQGARVLFRGRADRIEFDAQGRVLTCQGGVRAWLSSALWRDAR